MTGTHQPCSPPETGVLAFQRQEGGFWRLRPGRILTKRGAARKRENSHTWKSVRQFPKEISFISEATVRRGRSTGLRVRPPGVLTAIYWLCDLRSSHLTFLKPSLPRGIKGLITPALLPPKAAGRIRWTNNNSWLPQKSCYVLGRGPPALYVLVPLNSPSTH